jgi:hypothetical protein
VRHLFDDSIVLVDDPSLRESLADPTIVAVSSVGACVGGDVGGDGADYSAVAERGTLPCGLGMDPGGSVVRYGLLDLLAFWKKIHCKAAWRAARNGQQEW